MTRRKCYEIADAIFYNEEKVPDKMLYIQRIMLSCTTREQLASTYGWGRKVIDNISDTVSDRVYKKYGLWEHIIISGRFTRRCGAVSAQLKSFYNEIREKKKMW